MRSVKSFLVWSAFAAIFGGIFATAAIAQSPEGSNLRLTEPLEIGSTTLEPGVYMIRVLPGTDRNMLQVTNEDRTKTFATVLAVPHANPATAEQRQMQYVYFPATAGSARALRTWFAPNAVGGGGYDIVYPEMRAMQLAPMAKGPVVAYDDGLMADDLKTAELKVVTPDKKVMVYMAPDGGEMTTEATTEKPMVLARADELPRTASPVPFFVALGFLLLITAGGIQVFRSVQR